MQRDSDAYGMVLVPIITWSETRGLPFYMYFVVTMSFPSSFLFFKLKKEKKKFPELHEFQALFISCCHYICTEIIIIII